ncbi:MAG TPA: alpha/beta hydrolase-fold protein [Candidatus Acidoferrum sp.]|nr:alpha/beta hydrolase-fold protein [Candidatus Acidoferrum sp.]
MRRNRTVPAGEVRRLTVESNALKGNLLGDPTTRELRVYLPAGYDKGRRYPLLVDVVGFTGSGQIHTNWRPFTENLPERLDRLIGEGGMAPVVVAFPDCFSRLGGNQYINSAAIGRYEDYLVDEVVPLVERELGCGGPGRRAIFGKSSGGYGAIVHGMRRPDIWAALACHSGDMAFEICYLNDMPLVLNELAKHDRSIEAFMHAFEQTKKPKDKDVTALNALAMAATYDPDPTQFLGIRLPVDLETCELIPERWKNWLAHDPVRMVDACADNLRRLKAIYIDCGGEDQFHLHYGARQLNRALTRLGIAHTYEEFPDNHSDIDYRMDISLPFLARALE